MFKCENCYFVYNSHQRNMNQFTSRQTYNPFMNVIEMGEVGCCPACGSPYCSFVEIGYTLGEELSDLAQGGAR